MKYVSFLLYACLCAALVFYSGERRDDLKQTLENMGFTAETSESGDEVSETAADLDAPFIVIIDPGHGGVDPGKVGVNNVDEKEINLAIAFRLKTLLELNDVQVILTRETDDGLYDPSASNKKADDLKKRVRLIEESGAALTVSIHQNSYPDESCRGAQTFYYTGSTEGKALAEILQKQLKSVLADGNHREAKQNSSYYMLKKSQCPTVIVECGFLSSPQEAALLASLDYQEKIAFALHLGILEYRNKFLLY